MPIVTLDQMKEQLAFTADLGDSDDALIERKIAAAQDHIERLLGFKIEVRHGSGPAQTPIPPALVEAVFQLAAWWYETREAASDTAAKEVPYSVAEIVREYRDWSF